MEPQLIFDALSRWAHVGTAIVLVGGSVFMRFALLPAASKLSDEEHDKLRDGIMSVWRKFIHIGILLFIISGFYNFSRMVPNHKGDSLYHALVGTKILLAFVVFFLASALAGRSKTFEGMRQNRKKWLSILILLAAVIVGISGFVKVRKYTPPANSTPTAADTESDTES